VVSAVWCIVPVKRLADAKRRLAPFLSSAMRRELVLAMLRDTLDAIANSDVAGVLLASSDAEATEMARAHRTEVLPDDEAGGDLSRVVGRALAKLAGRGIQQAMVVPADIPGAKPVDLRHLADAFDPRGVVFVPDRRGEGTNAMLLDPAAPLRLRFGPGSLDLHVRSAADARLQAHVLALPSLSLDIDTLPDLAVLADGARRSRAAALARDIVLSQPGASKRAASKNLQWTDT
jgi:2-phospho-L-lactate guanylyltransferase